MATTLIAQHCPASQALQEAVRMSKPIHLLVKLFADEDEGSIVAAGPMTALVSSYNPDTSELEIRGLKDYDPSEVRFDFLGKKKFRGEVRGAKVENCTYRGELTIIKEVDA